MVNICLITVYSLLIDNRKRPLMRTVSIFKNGTNQAIRFPKEMEFSGISELEITKIGDRLILQPVRPSWLSFATCERASDDFMVDREEIIVDENRVSFD